MRYQVQPLVIAVLSGKLPEVFGLSITHHHPDSNITYACHVDAKGIHMGMWQGTTLLHSYIVFAHAFETDGTHRSAAAYSALAHLVRRAMLNLKDFALVDKVVRLVGMVRAHDSTSDSADNDGYWKQYRNDVGMRDLEGDGVLDEDPDTIVDELRDIFYENLAFDFTSPSHYGYWAHKYDGQWLRITYVDESWAFVCTDTDDILPSAFFDRYVKNAPRSPHVLVDRESVFEILPELDADTHLDWVEKSEARKFLSVPKDIVVKCIDDMLDCQFEIETTRTADPDVLDIEYNLALF